VKLDDACGAALPAKVLSRHFANKILKEVGLDRAF
jgi:hypothetical protein